MPTISICPSDAVRGGLITDVDVTVQEAKFVRWDYNGTRAEADIPALRLLLVTPEGEEHEQFFSCGGTTRDFAPSLADDGDTLEQVGSRTSLVNSCNYMLWAKSMVECGFNEDHLRNNGNAASAWIGTKWHLMRVPAKRDGNFAKQQTEGDRPVEIVVCSKLISAPYDQKPATKSTGGLRKPGAAAPTVKAPAKPKPVPVATTAAAAAAEEDAGSGDYQSHALVALVDIMNEAGGEIAAGFLQVKLLQRFSKHPQRAEIVALVKSPEFLTANGFSVVGSQIKLG